AVRRRPRRRRGDPAPGDRRRDRTSPSDRPRRPAAGGCRPRALSGAAVDGVPRGPAMNTLLWAVLPYVTIAILVVGSVWRYRYDKFGWTTRSSQLYEHRLLRI